MRELYCGSRILIDSSGAALVCRYFILVRTVTEPICFESYGVRIVVSGTGEQAEAPDLTVYSDRIEALSYLLLRGGVTPCALKDVVSDWLLLPPV